MIISCHNCRTAFYVSPEQIGINGRRVKCSKCKHIWYATIPQEILQPSPNVMPKRTERESESPASINLPVIISSRISKLAFLMPFLMLILIATTLLMFYPSFMNKYGLCYYFCQQSGVKIQDVTYDYDENTQKVIVEYSIANDTADKAKLPLVEIKLIDDSNNILQKTYIENNDIWLDPNNSLRAKTEFYLTSANSKYIQISLGNKFKFLFR